MAEEQKATSENDITFSDFDKLNLKPFAEILFNMMEKGTASSVGEGGSYTISLNAKFGNGKTTFLRMFKCFIEQEKAQDCNVIFINAWGADFYGEPIIAMLSEFFDLIQSQEIDKKEKEEIKDKIVQVIDKIANHRVARLTGNVVNQVVDKKVGINIKDAIVSCRKQPTKNENILEELNQLKFAIRELKDIILKYIENKKFLIIVDELDRARPDYAVHFLEDMKHFFDIPNVVFLVGVNREQMEITVKCLYGQNLDFDGYYRKFFKQEVDLPDPYKEVQNLIDDLIEKTRVKFYMEGGQNPDPISRGYRVESAYVSCRMFNLTLREINQFITIFEMVLAHDRDVIKWMFMDCYSFFICLFLKKKEVFNQILKEDFTVNQFCDFLNNNRIAYVLPDKPQTGKDIRFTNNYLLGIVACSFIRNQDMMKEDKNKVIDAFQSVGRAIDHILSYEGFDLSPIKGQSAVNICKKINECQSAFSN